MTILFYIIERISFLFYIIQPKCVLINRQKEPTNCIPTTVLQTSILLFFWHRPHCTGPVEPSVRRKCTLFFGFTSWKLILNTKKSNWDELLINGIQAIVYAAIAATQIGGARIKEWWGFVSYGVGVVSFFLADYAQTHGHKPELKLKLVGNTKQYIAVTQLKDQRI